MLTFFHLVLLSLEFGSFISRTLLMKHPGVVRMGGTWHPQQGGLW